MDFNGVNCNKDMKVETSKHTGCRSAETSSERTPLLSTTIGGGLTDGFAAVPDQASAAIVVETLVPATISVLLIGERSHERNLTMSADKDQASLCRKLTLVLCLRPIAKYLPSSTLCNMAPC